MERWKSGKTVYFHNTVSTTDAIFKRDPEGNRWTKFHNGIEVMTNNSPSAWQSFILCLREVTKKEYDNFENNPLPYYEDVENDIFIH
jgi:hypothetical protein